MHSTFIERHIKSGNRNLLLIGLALTIIGVGLFALLDRWFPALLAVPGLIAMGAWLIRVVNPSGHPIYKRLARYGDAQKLARQVNQEFAGVERADVAQFGANWLAQADTYGLFLVPWHDIAWIHIYVKKVNGVASNYVRVWSRDSQQFVAPAGSIQEAEQLLYELNARASWAEVGYSRELLQQWNKQRAEFLRRVDARRRPQGVDVGARVASGGSRM